MESFYGMFAPQGGSTWWSGAGIVVIALVICCLVMMFTMRRGMGGKSRNETRSDKQPNNAGEEPGTKKP